MEWQESGDRPQLVDYATQNGLVRVGLNGPGTRWEKISTIIDVPNGQAYVLFEERLVWTRVLLREPTGETPPLELGPPRVVAGQSCEEMFFPQEGYDIAGCVTRGGPYVDLDAIGREAGFAPPAWLTAIVDNGFVPVELEVRERPEDPYAVTGRSTSTFSLDPSLFAVPVEWRRVEPFDLPMR